MKTPTKQTAHRLAAVIITALATTGAWAVDRTWVGSTGTADAPRDTYEAENWSPSAIPTGNDNLIFANEGEYTYLTNTYSSSTRTYRVVNFNTGDYSFSGNFSTLSIRGGAASKRASVLKKSGDWEFTNDFTIGRENNNTLIFTNESGNVTGTPTGNSAYYIGQGAGAYAKLVNLDGTLSFAGQLNMAKEATSTGVVEMVGGTLEVPKIVKGNESGSASIIFDGGTLKAKSAATTFIPSGIAVTVGDGDGTIDNGGYNITIGAAFGGADDTGRLHLTGDGTTTLSEISDIENGKIVVDGGTVSAALVNVGNSAGNTGLLEVNGGTVNLSDDLYLGNGGDGTLTINGGAVEVDSSKQVHPGWASGSQGTVNLNGGVLKTQRISQNKGSGALNFNGGTLQANADSNKDFIKSGITVNVVASGTIDNGGFAITIPAELSGYGNLTFKGSGTTTLSGSVSSYSGVTRVVAGSTPQVSEAIATKLLLNGLVLAGAPELNTPYTILASSNASDDWSSLNLSNVTCPVASEFSKEIGADGKSIVVTITALKSGYVWTGAKDGNMSDADNWLGGVVPADGADIDLSAATTVNADLDRTFGAVTMGASVVTFMGDKMRATSFSDTSKVAVGADSTVTIAGDLEFSSGGNSYVCNYVGDGGAFVVTGNIIATSTFVNYLDPCKEPVGTGVVAAKGIVNDAVGNKFRLVRAIDGYHANWLIGEHGLSGSKAFAVSGNANGTAKIIAAADFTISNTVAANKALELDTAGHTVAIEADYKGSGERIFSGFGTVEVASGIDLGTGAITLGAGTTFALITSSKTFTPLANTITLPSIGAATIRIDGTRLRGGEHVLCTLASVPENPADHVTVTGEALDGRKYDVKAVEETEDETTVTKLVLNILPDGLTVIFR